MIETERTMLDRLNVRYGKTYRNGGYVGREFSRAEHVPESTGYSRYGSRIADFIAVRFFNSHGLEHISDWRERSAAQKAAGYPESTPTVIGHEVKVSRSDWLSELREPEKAEAWKQYCHYWYLVVSDLGIVKDDLPEGWGLMVKHGRSLRVVKRSPRATPKEMPIQNTAALLRATMKTEVRLAERLDPTPA